MLGLPETVAVSIASAPQGLRHFATHVSGTSKRNDHGCTHGDDERRERDRAELWCKLVKQSATPDMRRIGRTSVGRCKELGGLSVYNS